MSNVKYDYVSLDAFLEGRALSSHMATRNDVLFGQILRNVMKHAFECGVIYAGGEIDETGYE